MDNNIPAKSEAQDHLLSGGFGQFISSLGDSEAQTLLNGANYYANYIPKLTSMSQGSPLTNGEDYYGPNRPKPEETTWGKKAHAALYFENLAGRAVYGIGDYFNNAFSVEPDMAKQTFLLPMPDGTIKTDFTPDEYFRVNEKMFKDMAGGQDVLDEYLRGEYDGMKPYQLMAAIGSQLLRSDIQGELKKTTGSWIGDFSSVMAGSLPDPVTFALGGAALRGGKAAIAAARGEKVVEAAKIARAASTTALASTAGQAASVATEVVPKALPPYPSVLSTLRQGAVRTIFEGISQNTVRSLGLTAYDPEDHTFQEYLSNVGFGLAIDSTRSLAGSILKWAINKPAYEKLAAKVKEAEATAKARQEQSTEQVLPDAVIETAKDIADAKDATKGVADAKDAAISDLEQGQPLAKVEPGVNLKQIPEFLNTTEAITAFDEMLWQDEKFINVADPEYGTLQDIKGIVNDAKATQMFENGYQYFDHLKLQLRELYQQQTTPEGQNLVESQIARLTTLNKPSSVWDAKAAKGLLDVVDEHINQGPSLIKDVDPNVIQASKNMIGLLRNSDGNPEYSFFTTANRLKGMIEAHMKNAPNAETQTFLGDMRKLVNRWVDKAHEHTQNLMDAAASQAMGESLSLSPEENKALMDITKKLMQSEATPLPEETVKEQLDKIANRSTQMFNYGRLDEMGLRKVKIEQPLVNAIFQKIVPPEGFNLDMLLAALKKLSLNEKMAVLDEANLADAVGFFQNALKGDAEAAANAVIDLAEQFQKLKGQKPSAGSEPAPSNAPAVPPAEGGQNKFWEDAPKEKAGLVKSPTSVEKGTFSDIRINDAQDYMPDRGNDAQLKLWNKLREMNDARSGTTHGPTDTGGAFISGGIHSLMGTAMKFELSDNPLDRAIFDIYSAGTAGIAMKGETRGTLKPIAPFEKVKGFYQDKANMLIQEGLRGPFNRHVAQYSLAEKIIYNVTAGTKDAEAELWTKYTELTERLRLARHNGLYSEHVQNRLNPELKDFDALFKPLFDEYKGQLFPTLSEDAAYSAFQSIVKELDDNGILSLGELNNKKLSAWMTVRDANVISHVTSIELARGLDIAQLDDIFTTLFNVIEDPEASTGNVDQFPYKGIAVLLQDTYMDPETKIIVSRKYGPVTVSEVEAAIKDGTVADICNRLTEYYNDNWAGLAPSALIEPLIEKYGKENIRLSSERYIRNSSRFLAKLALSSSLYQRLKEFHVIEVQKYPHTENVILPFDKEISFYQQLTDSLAKANNGSPSAKGYRNFSKFNEDALAALFDYNRRVYAPRMAKELGKPITDFTALTGELENYMKARLGMVPTGTPSPMTDALITGAQAMMLHTSGINMLGEGVKAISNALTLPTAAPLKGLKDALVYDLKKMAISKENAGLMLESMTTFSEDVGHLIGRISQETDGPDGFSVRDPSYKDVAKGVANRWRQGIGWASFMDFGANLTKRFAFFNEYRAHVEGENSLFNLSAKIIDRINQGFEPAEASKIVAEQAGLKGLSKDNLFYHFSALAGYFSHDEIRQLRDIINVLDTNKTPFKPDMLISPEDLQGYQELAKKMGMTADDFRLKTRSLGKEKTLLGSILAPDEELGLMNFGPNYRDGMFKYMFSEQGNVVKPAPESTFSISEKMSPADLLRKFGRYLNYAIEQKNMNIPTALSDWRRVDPQSFPFKVITQFMRTQTAQVINTLWGSANRGTVSKVFFTSLLAGVGMAITVLKAYINDTLQYLQNDTKNFAGWASTVNRTLDYAGVMPVLLSKPFSALFSYLSPNAMDRSSAMNEFLPMPFSAAKGTVDMFAGVNNLVQGQPLTAAQKRWIRKWATANFADTTIFRAIPNIYKNYTDWSGNENALSDFIDSIYGKPQK